MKTKEELNALKEEVEVETESKERQKLTEEELAQVSGGGEFASPNPLVQPAWMSGQHK